jgi:hypothetical protein
VHTVATAVTGAAAVLVAAAAAMVTPEPAPAAQLLAAAVHHQLLYVSSRHFRVCMKQTGVYTAYVGQRRVPQCARAVPGCAL